MFAIFYNAKRFKTKLIQNKKKQYRTLFRNDKNAYLTNFVPNLTLINYKKNNNEIVKSFRKKGKYNVIKEKKTKFKIK